MQIFDNLDLRGNKLLNWDFARLDVIPTSHLPYFDNQEKHFKIYDGAQWQQLAYAKDLPHLYSYNLQCKAGTDLAFNVFFYAGQNNSTVEDLLTLYGCERELGVYYSCNGVGINPLRIIVGLSKGLGSIDVKYVEYDGATSIEKISALSSYVKKVIQIF